MKRWWPFALTMAILVLDRASKRVIETTMNAWDVQPVIPGLFQIVHTRNTGIAFGFFASYGSRFSAELLIAFSFAVMLLIGSLLWTACKPASSEHWTMQVALALVLGGAIGNLYDRIFFGSVTDFLDFFWGHAHFPIFNLADSAITVGAGLLLVNLWVLRKPARTGQE